MEVTHIDEEFPWLGSGLPRSPGLHVSSVIGSIQRDLGKGFPVGPMDEAGHTRCELGFWWEDLLSMAFAKRYNESTRIFEVRLDGLIGSPDGVREAPVLDEFKATSRGMGKGPWENVTWMMQVKSYCHMLTNGVIYSDPDTPAPPGILGVFNVVEFRILHWNGDYKVRPYQPLYRAHRIEFTEDELEENWAVLVKQAQTMREKGEIDD